MRSLLSLAAVLATLVLVPAASAQTAASDQIPAPQAVVIHLGPTPTVELSDGGGGLPYLASTKSYNAGDGPALAPLLAAYHDSGTYSNEITQIDARAAAWVRHSVTAAHKKHTSTTKLAVVFDVDETALSNYSAIVADGFVFGPRSRAEATDEIGAAIVQTRGVYALAQAKHLKVFLITGRPEAQRAPTEDNLRREGYANWAGLTLKPAGYTGTTVTYKSDARAAIERQGYRIVANVGDQYSDLAGGHADRAFKLPNPFYFLP